MTKKDDEANYRNQRQARFIKNIDIVLGFCERINAFDYSRAIIDTEKQQIIVQSRLLNLEEILPICAVINEPDAAFSSLKIAEIMSECQISTYKV